MQTQSVICTLFEGHYHYGVAALVNSLYQHGFRGNIYAGYRGELPFWAKFPESDVSIEWKGSKSFEVADGLRLHFLPIETTYHFANYKPDFMLRLWKGPAKDANHLYYFDPDIVIYSKWSHFEIWVSCGLALCEDVNSPLPKFHPRRVVWRRHFREIGINLLFKERIYVNAGFIGVCKKDFNFLQIWKNVLANIETHIGGLNRSSLPGGPPLLKDSVGPFNAFELPDQDALNIAVEAWDGEISFVGKEGMAFKYGSNLMMHAIGQPKPWKKNYVLFALKGKSSSSADKAFFMYTQFPILIFNKSQKRIKYLNIKLAALISRFYHQSY